MIKLNLIIVSNC